MVFYTAARYRGNKPIHGIEYVVQADALEDFKSKVFYYTSSTNIFYMNGTPSESQIALAAGDYVEGLTKMWGEALHSAEWWFSSITILADAVVSPFLKTSVPKNKQRLDNYFQKWQSAKNNLSADLVRDINVLWADRGYIANNAKTIFKATDDEIAQAAERIKAHRIKQNAGTSGNYGHLEGIVDGKVVDNKMWRSVSSDIAENEIHIFKAIEISNTRGNTWLRITDSEYRMLNNLAKDLGAKKGKIYPHIKGEIKIISENPYCSSCTGIIQQFNEMFPNVKLILIDGVKQ